MKLVIRDLNAVSDLEALQLVVRENDFDERRAWIADPKAASVAQCSVEFDCVLLRQSPVFFQSYGCDAMFGAYNSFDDTRE